MYQAGNWICDCRLLLESLGGTHPFIHPSIHSLIQLFTHSLLGTVLAIRFEWWTKATQSCPHGACNLQGESEMNWIFTDWNCGKCYNKSMMRWWCLIDAKRSKLSWRCGNWLISEGRGGVRLKREAKGFYAAGMIHAKTLRWEETRNRWGTEGRPDWNRKRKWMMSPGIFLDSAQSREDRNKRIPPGAHVPAAPQVEANEVHWEQGRPC